MLLRLVQSPYMCSKTIRYVFAQKTRSRCRIRGGPRLIRKNIHVSLNKAGWACECLRPPALTDASNGKTRTYRGFRRHTEGGHTQTVAMASVLVATKSVCSLIQSTSRSLGRTYSQMHAYRSSNQEDTAPIRIMSPSEFTPTIRTWVRELLARRTLRNLFT